MENVEDRIMIDPQHLVNHALKNDCRVVDTDRDNTIWIERKSNRSLRYFVFPGRKLSLQQAQFACLQSLHIPLMQRKDWE